MPSYKPILQRFHEKYVINPQNDCWEWQGNRVGIGYGALGGARGGKSWMAHRYSYTHFVGEIPEGMVICHRCDNPSCVNPKHLFAADHHANMRDMAQKGRARALSAEEVKECIARFDAGQSMSAIARDMGVARMTVKRSLDIAQTGDFGGAEPRRGSRYYKILTDEERSGVRFAIAEGKMSIMQIAKIFGVDRRTVRNIRDGKQVGRFSKLSKSEAQEIVKYWESGFRQHEIADLFGIDQTHVSRIVRGKSWAGVKADARKTKPTPPEGIPS